MTIYRYALIRGVRAPLSLAANCIMPLAIMFIFPLWADGAMHGFSLLTLFVVGGAYLMSLNILADKADGAVLRILAAPVTMRRYLTANLFACMTPLIIQMTLVVLIGSVLHGWSLPLSMALFLCYTVLTITSVTMSFAWHCLFKDKESNPSNFSIVLTLMLLLSGVFVPLEFFPGILQHTGAIFPVYWAVRSLDEALVARGMSVEYWQGIGAMLLFAVAFLLYGGKRRIV